MFQHTGQGLGAFGAQPPQTVNVTTLLPQLGLAVDQLSDPIVIKAGDKTVTVRLVPSFDLTGASPHMRITLEASVTDGDDETSMDETPFEETPSSNGAGTPEEVFADIGSRLDSIEKKAEALKYTYSSMEDALNAKLESLRVQEELVEKKCIHVLAVLEAAQKKRAAYEKTYERIMMAFDEFIPDI